MPLKNVAMLRLLDALAPEWRFSSWGADSRPGKACSVDVCDSRVPSRNLLHEYREILNDEGMARGLYRVVSAVLEDGDYTMNPTWLAGPRRTLRSLRYAVEGGVFDTLAQAQGSWTSFPRARAGDYLESCWLLKPTPSPTGHFWREPRRDSTAEFSRYVLVCPSSRLANLAETPRWEQRRGRWRVREVSLPQVSTSASWGELARDLRKHYLGGRRRWEGKLRVDATAADSCQRDQAIRLLHEVRARDEDSCWLKATILPETEHRALLFWARLTAAGLRADLALVASRNERTWEMPGPWFDRCLVVVYCDGDELWLDPNLAAGSPVLIGPSRRGRRALRLAPGVSQLEIVPGI